MYGNSDFVTVQDGMSVNRPLQRVQCVKLDWTAATSVQSWFSDRRSGSPSYTRWRSGSPGGTRASSATALWTFDRVFPCADAPPPSDHEIVRPSAFAVGPCWSSVVSLHPLVGYLLPLYACVVIVSLRFLRFRHNTRIKTDNIAPRPSDHMRPGR